MSKLYVLAIGGSGSRVLRALTLLLAAGVETKNEIVPVIIDPDEHNGDLVRTVKLMRKYESMRNSLDFGNGNEKKFFSSDLHALNSDGQYILPLTGTSGISFRDYLELSNMSPANRDFMEMLFSNANLASDMNVGFKGNPNIGSVVLNQITGSDSYDQLSSNFMQGDKVFIINSIFGGTGASGFPLLLKTIRESKYDALRNAPIGAVTLLPYFNLASNPNSSIDADTFVSKAKAALDYYRKGVTGNDTLNDIYYIGDDSAKEVYDNCEGGNNQCNKAHMIELIAALALIDFERKSFNSKDPIKTEFHEFALEKDAPNHIVDFSLLDGKTNSIIRRPLIQFTIMSNYLNNRDAQHRAKMTWAMETGVKEQFFDEDFYRNFQSIKEEYEQWLKDMADNMISFKPFVKVGGEVDDVIGTVVGIEPKYKGIKIFGRKEGADLLDEIMSKMTKNIHKDKSAESSFIELFYRGTKMVCAENLNVN